MSQIDLWLEEKRKEWQADFLGLAQDVAPTIPTNRIALDECSRKHKRSLQNPSACGSAKASPAKFGAQAGNNAPLKFNQTVKIF